MDVIFRIDPLDVELAEAMLSDPQLEPQLIKSSGMDGGNDLISVLITLGTHSLTALVAILVAKWRKNKNVSIEVGGMKVKGADPEQIEGILKQMISAKEPAKKSK